MTSMLTAYARTALSPEWDHGFDEAFTDLVTSDPDLVRDEFDGLIGANWDDEPPEPPAPPAPPAGRPVPPPPPADPGETPPAPPGDEIPVSPGASQRSPP